MKKIIYTLIIIILFSCRKDKQDHTQFLIKKGDHYSIHLPELLKSDTLRFTARFSYSCLTQVKDSIDRLDINKLYGFSECNDKHHENSARLGWRSNGSDIEIFAYIYNEGKRVTWFLNRVKVNEYNSYFIIISGDSYIIGCNDIYQIFERTNKCDKGFYYKLFPYFGGNQTAPITMSIFIKEY